MTSTTQANHEAQVAMLTELASSPACMASNRFHKIMQIYRDVKLACLDLLDVGANRAARSHVERELRRGEVRRVCVCMRARTRVCM